MEAEAQTTKQVFKTCSIANCIIMSSSVYLTREFVSCLFTAFWAWTFRVDATT